MAHQLPRVLLIEDDDVDREAVHRLLRGAFEVINASSGKEGEGLFDSRTPDCVLLDYRLPDVEGLDLLKNFTKEKVAVVMLTGHGDEATAVDAMKSGAHDYLSKAALDAAGLRRAINHAIEKVSLRRKLEFKQKELQQFVYIASHDLQEPLRTASSFAQLLARRYREKLDDDADDFIDYILDANRRMKQLIQDLLSYSRVETRGKIFEQVDCTDVLEKARSNLLAAIKESQALITNDQLPVASGDSAQLIRLFQNLLGNAIKFRGNEAPRIHVGGEKKNGECLIFVRDNGIGIDPRESECIFEISRRLHGHERPGTGIGLSICRKIVKRHRGSIWVESQPGQGATFYFTLKTEGDNGR